MDNDILAYTTEIVAAHVSHNAVPDAELPTLIGLVHDKLVRLADGEPETAPKPAHVPAVPIAKSVTPDYIVCLEDGKKFKSMRRHLTQLGMTEAEYKAKWGLPAEYPLVAPNYAKVRSGLAKASGLGRKGA